MRKHCPWAPARVGRSRHVGTTNARGEGERPKFSPQDEAELLEAPSIRKATKVYRGSKQCTPTLVMSMIVSFVILAARYPIFMCLLVLVSYADACAHGKFLPLRFFSLPSGAQPRTTNPKKTKNARA